MIAGLKSKHHNRHAAVCGAGIKVVLQESHGERNVDARHYSLLGWRGRCSAQIRAAKPAFTQVDAVPLGIPGATLLAEVQKRLDVGASSRRSSPSTSML